MSDGVHGAASVLGSLVTVAAITGLVLVAVIAWTRRRQSPVAWWLLIIMVGAVWWCVAQLAAQTLDDPRALAVAYGLRPLGAVVAASGYFLTVRALADSRYQPKGHTWLGLALAPALYLLVLAIPVTRDDALGRLVQADGQWWWHPPLLFWALVSYSLLLALWAAGSQAQAMRYATPLHRAQLGSNLVGALLPLAGGVISMVECASFGGQWPSTTTEWMTVGFLGTALVDIRSLAKHQLLTVVPIAPGLVLDELTDGVIVLDEQGRVTDVNPAAELLLGPGMVISLGQVLDDALAGFGSAVVAPHQTYLTTSGREIRFQWHRVNRGSEALGSVVVLSDVTEFQRSRRALIAANEVLREQLVTIESLRAELAELAQHDSLTGLLNRRHLDDLMTDLGRGSRAFGLMLIDLDHFKVVNDTWGHLVGDEALAGVAEALRTALTEADTLVRFGGEEFVVIMVDRSTDQARELAERVRARLQSASISTRAGAIRLTVSIGVARRPDHGLTPMDIIRAADAAMYRAKAGGRNRVEVASPSVIVTDGGDAVVSGRPGHDVAGSA
ncbi:MAG: diguanylate cyclase [Actinomycetales bacterium]